MVDRRIAAAYQRTTVAVFVGAIFGSLLTAFLMWEGRVATGSAPAPPSQEHALLPEVSVSGLERDIERLRSQMDDVLALLEIIQAEGTGGRREPVDQGEEAKSDWPREEGLDESARRGGEDGAWVAALDKSITRTLVERGLTPFTPGVAAHVRATAGTLRALDTEFRTLKAPLDEDLKAGRLLLFEYGDYLDPLKKEMEDKKNAAIEQLAAALDALDQPPR